MPKLPVNDSILVLLFSRVVGSSRVRIMAYTLSGPVLGTHQQPKIVTRPSLHNLENGDEHLEPLERRSADLSKSSLSKLLCTSTESTRERIRLGEREREKEKAKTSEAEKEKIGLGEEEENGVRSRRWLMGK
jgi:hypothetical protein